MMRTKKPQIGNVYSIELAPNKYAFGRFMNDVALEIYSKRSDKNIMPEDLGSVEFVTVIYLPSYKDKRLALVGQLAFNTEDESWPPPTYMHDPVFNKYQIYYKGVPTPADKSDCIGLESTSVWSLDHLIDRINGDTTHIHLLS